MKTFYSPRMISEPGTFSPSAWKPREVISSWRKAGIPLEIAAPEPARIEELCLAHDPAFVHDVLEQRIPNGFGNKRPDVAASLPYTSGAMLSAARWVIEHGGVAAAPCSGFHHACHGFAGGFCTFNGLMVAALALKREGRATRVGILDFDMHVGNGTCEIIEALRIDWVVHRTAGATQWTPGDVPRFLDSIDAWVGEMASCDVILYQAGADPHIDDPLGGWMTTAELRERDRRAFRAAKDRSIPLVWNLAGGYQEPFRRVLEIHDNTARECVSVYGA
jgi:acetoin utilization deacetylase AcuC-like enzyme